MLYTLLHPARLAPALCALLIGLTGAARAAPGNDDLAGTVSARIGDRVVDLPLLKSDYDVDIQGSLARVTLRQTFLNPNDRALDATYLFPLNQKAAVHAMTMEIGDEVIRAVIQRKAEAQETFEAAQAEGKTAALLDQHRPNMFTQNIANLMPGMPVTVTLEYVQTVPRVDDAYELVIPMVVGPRYEGAPMQDSVVAEDPGQADAMPVAEPQIVSGWTITALPAYPPVIGLDAPRDIDARRVSLDLALTSATPIRDLASSTHALAIEAGDHQATARFSEGREIDNRDLVLRYRLGADDTVVAGALSHFDDRGGVMSVQIEPPKLPADETITPREMVFVLDTSGSMNGAPMAASKTFMRAALRNLRPGDHFRILRFSDSTSAFARDAVPATQDNIRAGLRFVDGLSGGGGTEMNQAINTAFDAPRPDGALRVIVFLTDGYIGADREVIANVQRRIGDARIHVFGIGSAVNRYLLEGMAREGRGRVRYVEPGEDSDAVAQDLAARLDAPLLTDISIDWNGLAVADQVPARIPDLFAGDAINVMARYAQGGRHRIMLRGLVNGRPAEMPLELDLANMASEEGSPLPAIWARERVADLERDYTIGGGQEAALEQEITRIGLDYALQTSFTSFVAVSEKVYNPDSSGNLAADLPLPQVAGITANAYPSLNLGGSSTPEPEATIGLLAALAMMLLRFRRSVRSWLAGCRSRLAARRQPKGLPKRPGDAGWVPE